MKKNYLAGLATGLLLIGTVAIANGAPITSNTDLALTGADLINFEAQSLGNHSSLTIDNVIISGNLTISDDSNGIFAPPQDQFLDNRNGGNFTFDFINDVSAFGLQIGAVNSAQTLSSFDFGGNLIESLTIPYQGNIGWTGYYGLSSLTANISSFTLTGGSDWLILDDLSYVANNEVPEPATMLLFGTGLAGLIGYSRRKSLKK